MPRKRMIDPNFWRDEKLASCSFMERLLFEGLWTFAEDSGVGRSNPKLLKSDIFPYDNVKVSAIADGLKRLSTLGMIQLYEADGQQYYYIRNFKKHQTINRPSPSVLPLPTEDATQLTEDSLSTHGGLTSKENIREEKISKDKEKVFTPPTLDEIKVYCKERNSSVDPQRFFDYFSTGGWKDSKGNPVKNWKQKLITWEGNRGRDQPDTQPKPLFRLKAVDCE